jgi:hypothetical protein
MRGSFPSTAVIQNVSCKTNRSLALLFLCGCAGRVPLSNSRSVSQHPAQTRKVWEEREKYDSKSVLFPQRGEKKPRANVLI